MPFEYKVVGAPEKGQRSRGARTRSDRVAAAFAKVLADEAVDGWEYLRTDIVPIEEKAGLFSRREEVRRAVMIFRRALPEPRVEPEPVAAPPRPVPRDDTEPRASIPAPRSRSGRAEPEIRLAHSSDRRPPEDGRD